MARARLRHPKVSQLSKGSTSHTRSRSAENLADAARVGLYACGLWVSSPAKAKLLLRLFFLA